MGKMKYIVTRKCAGHLSGEVWEGDLVKAALNDGLNIDRYNSPEEIDREFDLEEEEERAIAAQWKAKAAEVGYPAAQISEDNASGDYWIRAEGDYELSEAHRFYEDFEGEERTYIAVPDKKEASFWMRYHVKYEKAHPGHWDPEDRLIRSLASKILRGEA